MRSARSNSANTLVGNGVIATSESSARLIQISPPSNLSITRNLRWWLIQLTPRMAKVSR